MAWFDRNNSGNNNLVRVFNRWPGASAQYEHKVPTKLTYPNDSQRDTPIRWGFRSNADCDPNHQALVKDGFKIDFGCLQFPTQSGPDPQAAFRSARKSYRDYLQKIYAEIKGYLPTQLGKRLSWDNILLHFVFSYPATWVEETIEEFKEVVREAGFGQAANHEASVCLTEPNAVASAAAYEGMGNLENGVSLMIRCSTSSNSFQELVLVVDAGGGTVVGLSGSRYQGSPQTAIDHVHRWLAGPNPSSNQRESWRL